MDNRHKWAVISKNSGKIIRWGDQQLIFKTRDLARQHSQAKHTTVKKIRVEELV